MKHIGHWFWVLSYRLEECRQRAAKRADIRVEVTVRVILMVLRRLS